MSRKDRWAALAADLGFEFKPGIDGFLESAAGRREIEDRVARGEIPGSGLEVLQSPLVRTLLEMLFDGAVVGMHRGHEFSLFASSQRGPGSAASTTRYSNVTMLFERGLDVGLHVYNETFLSRVGKVLFFQQDVQLGHPELDRLVMVKSKDGHELAVQALLGTAEVQQRLLTMFQASRGWEIRDQGIKHQEVADVISRARAIELMDWMVDLAERLRPA